MRRRSHRLTGLKSPLRFELALLLCFGLSLVAQYIGLAAIVGAFMAGLVLAELTDQTDMMALFEPVGWLLAPFFFVVMGSFIDPATFVSAQTLGLTAFFTTVAVVSKAVGAYLGALPSGRQVALEVGAGMVPRGEVGVVIAGIGLAAGVVGADVYAAAVAMVVLTTAVAPWLIQAAFKTGAAEPAAPGASSP